MDSEKQTLMDYFGIVKYHDYQLDLIRHISTSKNDVICRFRTGSGKSLTYLMPAILHGYTILVISPLCSLITDQVTQINNNVHKKKLAFNLSSSKSAEEENLDEKEVFGTTVSEENRTRIIFCTPEKLGTSAFRAKLLKMHKDTPFAYFVLDECHLIIESGNSFRADYMKVDWLRNELKDVPILCYSATCNNFVTNQIKTLLHMTDPVMFENDNAKKNLFLSIHSVSKHNQNCKCGSKNCTWHSKSDITNESILKAVNYYGGGEVLVLCNSRSDVEKLKQHIQKHIPNKKVEFYHAGLGDDSRSATQQQFVIGNIDILVATNASFGVGINLPLVLKVVVIGTPMSIQTISQAIGRGGRKGQQYYVDFYIKEADIIKNRIMLNKEVIGMSSTYKKYVLDSFDAVQYLVANSAADKSMCLLNIILQGVNATSTFLAVPYSDLQDFKKKNSTVRPYNRARWNSEARKWYLPPFAQNQAVAKWNTQKNTTDVLLETPECGKCSNCRNQNNISRFL